MQGYINNYSITTESLGSGGAASVFHCTRIADGEKLAIKKLQDLSSDKKARFEREIDVMLELQAKGVKGVMPILEYNKAECWYVMPVAICIDLTIKKWRKDAENASHLNTYREDIQSFYIKAFLNYANTLQAIHALGYTHRDIKPKNLYVMDGDFVIGDFGIVDLPVSEPSMTRKHDKLGAWNTMAPEVLRDARNTSPASDVYSLAKSLWMCLTLNEEGFDGRYDAEYDTISLHNNPFIKGNYFIDINDLLHSATQDDPEKRPDMNGFAKGLAANSEAENNFTLRNKREWDFIYTVLFRGMKPTVIQLTEREDICRTLTALGRYGVLNYSMLPDRGGLKLEGATIAPEEGCIYLDYGFTFVCRPKRLVVRSFINDELWNYFYLEFDELPFVLDDKLKEDLVEDEPGHYVSADGYVYGVYDYDTGEPYPDGYKRVERYCRGAIVYVAKDSVYNKIQQTSDGRHADCCEDEFFGYVCQMRDDVRMVNAGGMSYEDFYSKYSDNPFKPQKNLFPKEDTASIDYDVIKDNIENLDFSATLIDGMAGFGKYKFVFKHPHKHFSLFEPFSEYYLCTDGRVRLLNDPESPDIFVSHDMQCAKDLQDALNGILKTFVESKQQVYSEIQGHFTVEMEMDKYPARTFNYRELKESILSADDRMDNYIVVNAEGYIVVVGADEYNFYPVRSSFYSAGNNYVGPYSKGILADTLIDDFLGHWLMYLEGGRAIRQQEYNKYEGKPRTEVRKEINQIIASHGTQKR